MSGGIVGWDVNSKILEEAVLGTVPRYIPNALVRLVISYLPKQENVFGESDWNELCGRVAPAPPLPLDIEKIWEGPCSIFEGDIVKKTHVLVYLPTTVDDNPLTLKNLGKIAKQRYFPSSERGYKYIWDRIVKQMGDQPVDTSRWVLMTKIVIDGSRNASYTTQQTMITDLANKAKVPYTVPTVLQATICILTHYMRTSKHLFSDSPSTYTRCQESIDRDQLVVGGFSPDGLSVYFNVISNINVGVAVLRKFSSISSSSSSYNPPAVSGGIVGWSVDSRTVKKAVLAAVPSHIPNVLAILMASYVPDKQEGVFADNDWNELCGRVTSAPPLPLNIEEIWEGPCPIFPRKRVKDSHVLVYLPTTVEDKPLTLKTLGEIAKQRYFPSSERGYKYIPDKLLKQMGDQPVGTAGWALMTKTVIDGSRSASYATQQTMITDLANKAKVPYTVPTVLQATICILTHYMRTGTRLFNDSPSTYTGCQESIDGFQLIVGGFSPIGFRIYNGGIYVDCVGVAALRKFTNQQKRCIIL